MVILRINAWLQEIFCIEKCSDMWPCVLPLYMRVRFVFFFFFFKEFKQLPTWIALIQKCLRPQFDDDLPIMDQFPFAKCQQLVKHIKL